MNKEIKEQAHKEFKKSFIESDGGRYLMIEPEEIKSFLDSLIDKTVQMTEERVVGIVGFVDEEFLAQPDAEKYVGEWSINKDRQRILSLITNKDEKIRTNGERFYN